jgi:hypothetical protein
MEGPLGNCSLARRKTDNNAKRKRNRAKHDTASIQARVVYAEHCARRGALSKANQAITSNSMPNADPTNIDLLRPKHPEPAHPNSDPVRLSNAFYSDRLIGKLTTFLPFQEFSFRNIPVDSSTSSAQHSPHSLKRKSAAPSQRLQLCLSTLTLTGRLSLQELILTHHTRKLLVY